MRTPVQLVHVAVLAAACFLLHSANFNHAFLLDSGPGLVDNPAVRSLKNIPRYFADPSTLTSLRQNWDYRPILQATYALNYRISGYDMWSWHLFQIFLHFACVAGLYLFSQRILALFKPEEDRSLQRNIAFFAALIFAVHPYTSGVVNYLWARSSLLTAVFLLYSFIFHGRRKERGVKSFSGWVALALYTLALFTKVEAVAALGVYWLFEGMSRRRENERPRLRIARGFLGDVVRSLNPKTLRSLLPFLAVTCLYALIRMQVVPDFIAEARHSGDVTSSIYFFTQLTAWWSYVFNWFAPVNLIGDNLAYPVFRSVLQPEVVLAISGWLVVALVLAGSYRTHPEYMFFSVAALALISPTSSVMPLAEMVNEHRPYLPLTVLSVTWITATGRWLAAMMKQGNLARLQTLSVLFIVIAALSLMTFERNKVYATGESYWSDVVAKAPSARAYVNYGLELQRQGESDTAMEHFRKALQLAPRWHVIHINLALGYERLGQQDKAQYHYDRAVRDEMYGSTALTYRGEHYLRMGQYRKAIEAFEQSMALTTDPYSAWKGIATGSAGTGDWQKAAAMTQKMCRLDRAACEYAVVDIATPFWGSSTLFAPGIHYFQAIDQFLPEKWWIQQNIADLALKTGDQELAEKALAKAQVYKNSPNGPQEKF